MGIKGIKSLIKKHAPDAISEINLNDLSGKTICIDSSILMYKFRYIYSGDNFHIIGFLNKILEFDVYGIKVIFVFDGKPPEAKRETLNKRKEQNIKNKEQIIKLKEQLITLKGTNFGPEFIDSDNEDNEESNKESILLYKKITSLEKNIKTVTRTHSLEVMEMLKSIGIPFFAAEGEAEEFCVFLQTNGYADYILTEDTDSLTFGGSKIIFNKKNNYFVCHLDLVLKGLELNQDSFIDLCILCGCDYTCTIPKVGPVTALNIIKKHRSIEKYINTGISIPELFDYITARQLFKCGISIPITLKTESNKTKFVEILSKWNLNYFINKFNFYNFI